MTDLKIWEQRVAAWRSSGQSARQYAEGREFSVHMLRYWARQVATAPAAKAAATTSTASVPELRLARVMRPAAAMVSASPRQGVSHEAALVIEVGGARVAVRPGFDRATLTAVLDVLGRGGRP